MKILLVRRSALAVAAAALLLTGCGDGADTAGSGSSGSGAAEASDGPVTGTVVVAAAASLTGTFTRIAKDFEADNPGVEVTLNVGASSALANQIVQGGPVDVFAAASPATMKTVTDTRAAAGEPAVFVRNRLQIAVPKGNPGGIKTLADFAKPELKIALCAEQVPCGAAATKAFAAAWVTPKPDTLEQDVKAALSKVQLGEVDAALVYRTDVLAAKDKVEGLDVPEADKAVNDYPIVALKEAPNATAAAAFVDYVRSADGIRVLTEAGFEKP